MKTLIRLAAAAIVLPALTSCIFKEAVFKSGFAKIDGSLAGAWRIDEGGDDDKDELALCFPLDEDRYVIHYPVGDKHGCYFEARPIKVRDRELLQVRAFGSAEGKAPAADDEAWTIIWIEKKEPLMLSIRACNGDKKKLGPDGTRKFLEDAASDWSEVFGDAAVFKKVK